MARRRSGIGLVATLAIAVAWFLALDQLTAAYTRPFLVLAALAAAAVTTWVLNIATGVVRYYRQSPEPMAFPAVVRRIADTWTPPTDRVVRYAVIVVAATLVVSATLGSGVAPIDAATPSYNVTSGADIAVAGGSEPVNRTPIKTVTAPTENHLIQKVVLYEDGMANVTFATDHSCHTRVALVHETRSVSGKDTSGAIRVWDAPPYSGPLTVDLKRALRSGDYPSRTFRLELIAESGSICIGVAPAGIEITVPESYLSG